MHRPNLVVPFLALALLVLLVSPAVAQIAINGGMPGCIVSAPTGIFSQYSYEYMHDAQYWIMTPGPHTQEYSIPFAQNWGSADFAASTWAAFTPYEGLMAEMGTFSYPDLILGIFWSGANETRKTVPFEATLLGDGWGQRKLTIWDPRGVTVAQADLVSGQTWTTNLTALPTTYANPYGSYMFAITSAASPPPITTPEPSSLMAIMAGCSGGVFLFRRRRK